MTQLRVGIIGNGMAFEQLHLPAYKQLTAEYKITALCDDDLQKATAWAEKLGLDHSCVVADPAALARRDDVDVIDIMVPIELNYTVTRQVAEAIAHSHKGIISEKPLGATEEEIEAARELPQKYHIPILIAENYRYNEETLQIQRLVQEKRVGDPIYFIQNRVMDMPADMWKNTFAAKEWRQHPEFPGGIILDTGVHDIAALQLIFGAISEVHAYGIPQEADFAPYSVLQANLRFTSGSIGQFSMFTSGKEAQRPLIGLRIMCTNGEIFLEERDCGTVNVAYNDGRSEQIAYQPQQGYYRELLNFYNHMVHGEMPKVTPEIEFGDTKVMLAMLRSAKEGRPIKVEQQNMAMACRR